jgi:hypothetical protein
LSIGPDALFNNEYATDGSNQLTPEIIDAAVEYIRTTMKSTKKVRSGKTVYENADGARASAEFLKPILDSGWLCGAVSPTTDVILLFLLGLNTYVLRSDQLFELYAGH